MIDIVLRDEGSYFVFSLFEVIPSSNTIIIGSDFNEVEKMVFDTYKEDALEKFLNYNNLTDFVIDNIENSLTHEVIHFILYGIGGNDACDRLDKIDKNYEISGVRGCT